MFSWLYSEAIDSYTLKIYVYLIITVCMFIFSMRSKRWYKASWIPFVLSIIFILNSIFISIDSIISFRDAVLFALLILCAYSITLTGIIYPFHLTVFVKALLLVIIFSSVPMIIVGAGFKDGNFNGIFFNSNYLGLIISVICLPVIIEEVKVKKDILSISLFISLFVVLFYTRSRTAIVTAMMCIFMAMTCYQGRSIKFKQVFSVALIGIASSIFYILYLGGKYEDGMNQLATRMPLIEQRILAIKQKPWFGWGFASDTSPILADFPYQVFPRLEKGNLYLALLEEFGVIIGGVIIITLVFYSYRYFKNSHLPLNLRLFFPLALISSIGETWIFNPYGWATFVFWFLFLYSSRYLKK